MELSRPLIDLCRTIIGLKPRGDGDTQGHRGGAGRFTLMGPLSTGKSTEYSINGVDFEVTPETTILGELRYGALVHVSGTYRHHTVRCAAQIMLQPHRRESRRS